jgi:hypothetical protein
MNEGVVISGDERWLVTMRIEGGGEEGRGRASTQNNSESYFSLLTNFNIYSVEKMNKLMFIWRMEVNP